MNPHTHYWKRSKRQHKRPGRFFVECECGEKRQATISAGGSLKIFTTGVKDKGGSTIFFSFRLDKKRAAKLRHLKINIRAVMEKHIDKIVL